MRFIYSHPVILFLRRPLGLDPHELQPELTCWYCLRIPVVSGRRLLPLCQLLRLSRLWLLPRQSGARSRWHLRLVILPVLSLRR